MSFGQMWSHSSICRSSRENMRKPSLVDVISSTIDVAVSRVTSNHKQRLDTMMGRPAYLSKTSGRPTSLTYDDIISRSLMANCRRSLKTDGKLTENNDRKRKAREMATLSNENKTHNGLKVTQETERVLDEKSSFFHVYDLVSRTIVNLKDVAEAPRTGKQAKLSERGEATPRVNDVGVAATSPAVATQVMSKPNLQVSNPIELKATDELTSIPDFARELEAESAASKVRKPIARKPYLNPYQSRLTRTPSRPQTLIFRPDLKAKRRGGAPTQEPGPESKDTKLLFLSCQPQISRESLVFGESSEDVREVTEVWSESDKLMVVLSEWREQQLKDVKPEYPVMDRVRKYFNGRSFSKSDLRDFLRKSRVKQMTRLHSVVDGLNIIDKFIGKIDGKELFSDEQLVKELMTLKKNVLKQQAEDTGVD